MDDQIRRFQRFRIYTGFFAFPLLRLSAAAVPLGTYVLPKLMEDSLQLLELNANFSKGEQHFAWNPVLAIPYLLHLCLGLELTLTCAQAMINMFQGTTLITKNVYWNQCLDDFMDGFMFSSCASVGFNVLLMLNITGIEIPNGSFVSMIIVLSVFVEFTASWYSTALLDIIFSVCYVIELGDVPFKLDENNNDDEEDAVDVDGKTVIVCDLQKENECGAKEGIPI